MASLLLHIAEREAWRRAVEVGQYRGDTLDTQGFIHCSLFEQVLDVADTLYRGRMDLVLVCLDPGRLVADVRFESPGPGAGERFPHVYGPVNLDAVVLVEALVPGPNGRFRLPESVRAVGREPDGGAPVGGEPDGGAAEAEQDVGLGGGPGGRAHGRGIDRARGDRPAPSEEEVRALFDGLVERYDLLNSLLSLGLDRRWRLTTSRAVGAEPGERVLDLGCGTGDLSLRLPGGTSVVGIDVSRPMLVRAGEKASRATRAGLDGTAWLRLVQGSALRLPFADGSFDGAVSGFLLRNLGDLPAAFTELARVIRPGATVALVDITGPAHPLVRRAFEAYFGFAAPLAGRLAGKEAAYRYLVRSLAQLPPSAVVCRMLFRAGFADTRARRSREGRSPCSRGFEGTEPDRTRVRVGRPVGLAPGDGVLGLGGPIALGSDFVWIHDSSFERVVVTQSGHRLADRGVSVVRAATPSRVEDRLGGCR